MHTTVYIYRYIEYVPFMTEEFTSVCKRYDNHLCRNAAHLHDEVLPEVVLGKFHVAVRAFEIVDFVEKLYVGAASLLGLPVTQGGLSEVHAPYLPRAGRVPFSRRDMFGNDIY